MKILLLDNHDSFTYNLAELLRANGKVSFNVLREDEATAEAAGNFDKIIFSPGPGLPEEHPAMFSILKEFQGLKPILGICLGMQAIAVFYGGRLFNLPEVVHGQARRLKIIRPGMKGTSRENNNTPRFEATSPGNKSKPHYLFEGIPEDSAAGLYHSWAVSPHRLPTELNITAFSEDNIIMGLAHKTHDICGLQFHPESIITSFGQMMLDNWLKR